MAQYVSDVFTRPADTTPYSANDLVANNVTAGSVVPLTFRVPSQCEIWGARLTLNAATNTLASFKLYLFNTSPTVTNGDNGAFAPTASNHLGIIALDGTGSLTTTNLTVVTNLTAPIFVAGKPVFGLLLAVAAYTPTSAETFTVHLIVK